MGPKLAQAALSVLGPDKLREAIATEDLTRLMRVPGVGRKGAQRLVLELKDKVNLPRGAVSAAPVSTPSSGWRDQVSLGLQGLGWSARDADAACAEVEPLVAGDPEVSVAGLMKAALQTLARR